GHLLDIFTGTAAVARHFRARGFRVTANDRMRSGYTLARAALETPRIAKRRVAALLRALEEAPDIEGLVARQYAPAGPAGRRYFTDANARRIDAALEAIARRRTSGEASDVEVFLALASVIDAA